MSRVHILEIIELRAMNWQPNENVTAFYKQKLSQLEYSGHLDQIPPTTPCTPGLDSPGVGTLLLFTDYNHPLLYPFNIR